MGNHMPSQRHITSNVWKLVGNFAVVEAIDSKAFQAAAALQQHDTNHLASSDGLSLSSFPGLATIQIAELRVPVSSATLRRQVQHQP
jgi:hypothetical protein